MVDGAAAAAPACEPRSPFAAVWRVNYLPAAEPSQRATHATRQADHGDTCQAYTHASLLPPPFGCAASGPLCLAPSLAVGLFALASLR